MTQEDEGQSVSREVEASRYALLQRLAPAIRHQVAGTFQPLIMLASMVQRLLQSANVDMTKMGGHAASMHSFSQAGATASLGLFSWVSSVDRVDVSLNEGVSECINLVATELALREFTINNTLSDCASKWPRDAVRRVFMSTLLAISDNALSPAELVLTTENTGPNPALVIRVRSTDDALARTAVPIYRKIEWLDVEILAESERVLLERVEDGARLTLMPSA